MTKITLKMLTEDTVNAKCNTAEQEALLGLYRRIVEGIASGLPRTARFEIADFPEAVQQGVGGFCLTIERKDYKGAEHWIGSFRDGEKNLKIYAIVENPPCATSMKEDSN